MEKAKNTKFASNTAGTIILCQQLLSIDGIGAELHELSHADSYSC